APRGRRLPPAAREVAHVRRDHHPAARDLVTHDVGGRALARRHSPHLGSNDSPSRRLELCHVPLPSAGITRVRFQGSAGRPALSAAWTAPPASRSPTIPRRDGTSIGRERFEKARARPRGTAPSQKTMSYSRNAPLGDPDVSVVTQESASASMAAQLCVWT